MSLNWNITRVEDHKKVCYERKTKEEAKAAGTTIEELANSPDWYTPGGTDVERLANCDIVERMNPLTNALIWATMSVRLGSVTAENYGEFWLRINLLERLSGHFMSQRDEAGDGFEARPITLEEVKAHIGLGCNVSDESWSSWSKGLMDTTRHALLRQEKLGSEPWHPPISQVAKDTEEQLGRLEKALQSHPFYGDLEQTADERAERDLSRIYVMVDHVGCMATEWDDLEGEQEMAEMAEGEK